MTDIKREFEKAFTNEMSRRIQFPESQDDNSNKGYALFGVMWFANYLIAQGEDATSVIKQLVKGFE